MMSITMVLFCVVMLGSVGSVLGQTLQFTIPAEANAGFYTSGNVTCINGNHMVLWQLLPDNHVAFLVAAATMGWVGFGINNFPGMPGGDIAMGMLTTSSGFVLTDMFATAYAEPTADYVQDFVLTGWGQANGVTYFSFTRPFHTNCSIEDMQLDPTVTYYAMCAFGTSNVFQYHGTTNREATTFSLDAPVSIALPNNTQFAFIAAPNVTVPSTDGYVCSYHQLPPTGGVENQIVKFKTVMGSALAVGILHHMNMYACPNSGLSGAVVGSVVPCASAMASCLVTLLSGGYGPEGQSLPTTVGIPFGAGNFTIYTVIQRHIYNPGGIAGVVDSGSGFQIWYTSTLRPNNIGIVTLGTLAINVPPQWSLYDVPALCAAGCTSHFQPNTTVTSVNFHMHTHGALIYVQVIRNGVEVAELARVDPWDPSRPTINVNFDLQPGDTLWTHCVYNNPLNTTITYGSALNQEMCFAFLTVYPMPAVSECLDFPNGFGGTTPPACVGYEQYWNQPAFLGCNTSTPAVYCPNTGGFSAEVYNPPDRTAPFVPLANTTDEGGCTPVSVVATHILSWAIPASPSALNVYPGDTVAFVWVGSHNVNKFAAAADYAACNFGPGATTATMVSPNANNGVFYFDVPANATAGTVYYFACSYAGGQHCIAGMKTALTVVARPIDYTVSWTIPASPQILNVYASQIVLFSWASGSTHDVWSLPSASAMSSCNNGGAATQVHTATSGGSYEWTAPNTPGETYYFMCGVGSHCTLGMFLQITVLAGSPPSNTASLSPRAHTPKPSFSPPPTNVEPMGKTLTMCGDGGVFCLASTLLSDGKTLQITLNNTLGGWVGVGLAADAGVMAPADVMECSTATATAGAAFQVNDRYAAAAGVTPVLDGVGNLVTIATGSVNGVTTCTFRRLLVTTDTSGQDTAIVCGSAMNINYAFGASSQQSVFAYHGNNRFSTTFEFCTTSSPSPPKKNPAASSALSPGGKAAVGVVFAVVGVGAIALAARHYFASRPGRGKSEMMNPLY